MYFVYKNNMQMYLTKDEMVIKTWNKIYKFAADKSMFDAIQRLVGYLETPRTYEEIAEYFSDKKEQDLNRSMIVLLKTQVIMMQESIDRLQNKPVYRYENAEEILQRMETGAIRAINMNNDILQRIQKAGMKIITEGEGSYLLIQNDGNMEQLKELFEQYRLMGKKMILTGMHKGYIYILCCDETCNDIRKACYQIQRNEEEETTDYQIRIAGKVLENQCLEYFYAGKEQYNFTLIAPDLSVKNEWLNYHVPIEEGKKETVTWNEYKEEIQEADYPEIDKYINQLPFVGYFGSKDCEQMPLPEQTLWLINRTGELECKISAKGDTCENAMINCIRNTLIYMNGDKKTVVSINDNREKYYFEAIAEILFETDRNNLQIAGEKYRFGAKVTCFKHSELPVYMMEIWYKDNKMTVYGTTSLELEKKLRYAMIELGGRVEDSISLAEDFKAELRMNETSLPKGQINELCLRYMERIGCPVYERKLAYSTEMKDKGLYAGEFLVEGGMTNGSTE